MATRDIIEVVHNPLVLPIRRLYAITRSSSRAAKRLLDAFIDSKIERGYRLRVIPIHEKNLLELSSRHSLNVNMGVRALSDAGFRPRQVPYRNYNRILHSLREKAYK